MVFHKDGRSGIDRHRPGRIERAFLHHPLKNLFRIVLPIGRGRIGVVTLAHLITYQHRFCGLLRLIWVYSTLSCRAGSKLASNSRTAMRLFINAMGTGCYILLLINSVWPSMLHSLGHPRKVAGGV